MTVISLFIAARELVLSAQYRIFMYLVPATIEQGEEEI